MIYILFNYPLIAHTVIFFKGKILRRYLKKLTVRPAKPLTLEYDYEITSLKKSEGLLHHVSCWHSPFKKYSRVRLF